MNRLKSAHARPGGFGLAVLVVCIGIALLSACTTSSDERTDEPSENQVIGKPPAAAEDPFFVRKIPGEAVEAAPTGSIGEEDAADSTEPGVASRAPDPERQRERSRGSEQPQCFSCVRICPSEGDCDQARDDVICGWGVHETATQAKRLAKAECDATLDMARQMPVWSEIAGDCPVATCR